MTANPKLASDQKNLGNQGAFIDDKANPRTDAPSRYRALSSDNAAIHYCWFARVNSLRTMT